MPFHVIRGLFQARKLLGKLKPDVVFSKGGFVSVPVVIAAHWKKIPCVCHESDITPGLANKMCIRDSPEAPGSARRFGRCSWIRKIAA